jgi:release factor glutamine methyltransferase
MIELMTIQDAIAGSALPKADAEVLLAALLKKERSWFFAHGNEAMPEHARSRWSEWIERRKKGEPVAYITGLKEFFGRTYRVTPAVLVPRPATEALVEIALEALKHAQPQRFTREIDSGIAAFVDVWEPGGTAKTVCDVGTGSGCIGVSIALERPDLAVIATDQSPEALAVARENALALGARRVDFRLGDALAPLQDLAEPFLLISNPPYIPEGTPLEKDVNAFEPHEALFSGKDGTDVLSRILTQAQTHPQCIGVILECRMDQAKRLSA